MSVSPEAATATVEGDSLRVELEDGSAGVLSFDGTAVRIAKQTPEPWTAQTGKLSKSLQFCPPEVTISCRRSRSPLHQRDPIDLRTGRQA